MPTLAFNPANNPLNSWGPIEEARLARVNQIGVLNSFGPLAQARKAISAVNGNPVSSGVRVVAALAREASAVNFAQTGIQTRRYGENAPAAYAISDNGSHLASAVSVRNLDQELDTAVELDVESSRSYH